MDPVPATIVTGFLGSGKTSLANELLASAPPSERWAVLCNEAGEESMRDELRTTRRVELVEVLGGCACCTLNLQLVLALAQLARRASSLDRLLIETSGVADPVPVLRAMQAAPVRAAFAVEQVVTVVDARHAAAAIDPWLWKRQVGVADRIVVNKVDVATRQDLERIDERLRGAARDDAAGCWAAHGVVDPARLLAPVRAATGRTSAPVHAPAAHDGHVAQDGHGAEHDHDHADYRSVTLVPPPRISEQRLREWQRAAARHGGALRTKGTATLEDGRRVELQGVGEELRLRPAERAAPDRISVIGVAPDERALAAMLHERVATAPRPTTP